MLLLVSSSAALLLLSPSAVRLACPVQRGQPAIRCAVGPADEAGLAAVLEAAACAQDPEALTKQLSKDQLKAECARRSLRVSGTKAELAPRLVEALRQEQSAAASPPPPAPLASGGAPPAPAPRPDASGTAQAEAAVAADGVLAARKMAVLTTGAGSTTALVRAALASRSQLVADCHAEGTDCYRLFHGAIEGAPGCTLDRYGDLLLWQTFRSPEDPPDELLPQLQAAVEDVLGLSLTPHWNDRRKGARDGQLAPGAAELLAEDHMATELGLRYRIEMPPPGRDPLLYLDFRAARRWLAAHSDGLDVLNAFSFTCGAGVAALAGGARSVTNLDFSESALATGRLNAAANGLPADRFGTLCADALPALRSYAGLPVAQDRPRQRGGGGGARGRGARRGAADGGRARPTKVSARQFDVCVLDPPTWATTSYGAVDLVRDYQSLFKPCVLATRPGGTVLATNHVSAVDMEEWMGQLERCALKAGRPVSDMQVLPPEADFPSPDGRHPLKMVLVSL